MALFRILKHVEGMAQQLHLQNGFLHAQGLDGNRFTRTTLRSSSSPASKGA